MKKNHCYYNNKSGEYLMFKASSYDESHDMLEYHCDQTHEDTDDFVYIGTQEEIENFLNLKS